MDITKILAELVLIADSLDKRGLKDISSDLDAALFLMAQENAIPRNKALASLIQENKLALEGQTEEQLEVAALEAAAEIRNLLETVLQLDSVKVTAILKSISQSVQSLLDPKGSLSPEVVTGSSEFLAEAEKKLYLNEELHGVGYRVEMLRRKIENG